MMVFALFALALLLLAGGLIARPFVVPSPDDRAELDEEDDEALALSDERRRLLDAIRELDDDLAVGKLSEVDHRELRASYVGRAAVVMQRIEEARVASPAVVEPEAASPDVVEPERAVDPLDRIEEEIRARREVLRGPPCPLCGAPDPGGPLGHSCNASTAVGGEV